jgi:CBS domain-containing protein
MKIKDIMKTNIKTISSDSMVRDVANIMAIEHISGLPVVDDGQLVGIISEKDILQRMFPDLQDIMGGGRMNFEKMEEGYKSALSVSVASIMTKDVTSIDADMPCLKAASSMWVKNIRRIPVTENGNLVGIVSIGDVHRAIFKKSMEI